jgi:hypothetical protein
MKKIISICTGIVFAIIFSFVAQTNFTVNASQVYQFNVKYGDIMRTDTPEKAAFMSWTKSQSGGEILPNGFRNDHGWYIRSNDTKLQQTVAKLCSYMMDGNTQGLTSSGQYSGGDYGSDNNNNAFYWSGSTPNQGSWVKESHGDNGDIDITRITCSGDSVSSGGMGFVIGSVTPPPATNRAPVGYLDGLYNTSVLSGWALDPNDQTRSIEVHVYVDGGAGAGGTYIGSVNANMSRPDLTNGGYTSTNHGYHFQIPARYHDGRPHSYYVYGIDLTPNSNNPILTNSPKTYTIGSVTPPPASLGVTCSANTSSVNVGGSATWTARATGGVGPYTYYFSDVRDVNENNRTGVISRTYSTAGDKYMSISVIDAANNRTEWAFCSGHVTVSTVTPPPSNNNNIINSYNNTNNTTNNTNNTNNTTNNYGNNNPYYPPQYYNNNSPLYISCLANTSFAPVNSTVTWQANVSGGNGNYVYTWNGTDYLRGSSNLVNTTYGNVGTKTASVTVSSGGQSATQMCSNSVNIGSQYYNNSGYYTGNNIQVACYPDKTSVAIGKTVTWGVEAIGGSGEYTYAWTGSNGLSSNQPTVITTYGTIGTKSATVTVNSGGQTVTKNCGSSVKVVATSVGSGTKTVINPVVYQNSGPSYNPLFDNMDMNQRDNSLSAASLFSLKNVPWGWVAVLIILILMFTVMYLIFNRNKI